MLPPPYGIIVDELTRGTVVPFLGAGVNLGHRPTDATWSRYGSPFLSPDDIRDGPGLIRRLQQNEPIATQIRAKLSDATRAQLGSDSSGSAGNGPLMLALLQDLNALIRAPYEAEFLAGAMITENLRRALEALHDDALHALKRQILSDLFPEYVAPWRPSPSNFLPSGAELSRFLAGKAEFPSRKEADIENLAKTASYLVETSRRKKLREYLHELLDRDYPPCEIHRYLAEFSSTLPCGIPLVIVTTNYDDLLERAFVAVEAERANRGLATRPFDVVVHPTDDPDNAGSVLVWRHGARSPEPSTPTDLYIDLKGRTVIYKMHGSVVRAWQRGLAEGSVEGPPDDRHDSYVITEEDYIDFLSRMTSETPVPSILMRHFCKCYFLFLGYGLSDWNLRVLLRNLKLYTLPRPPEPGVSTVRQAEDQGDFSAWAIQHAPSDLERTLWVARKVRIFDIDINEFVLRLRVESRMTEFVK